MYGLLQGLQAGTRDAMSANEMALRERQMAEDRAVRQREMATRDREMAMREAQHGATMEQLGLHLKQQKGIDTAMEGIRGLATRDAAQQRQLSESGIMSFAPQDWTDTSERAYNQKYMGLAAAKGDAEGMNKLQMRNKLLEANDLAKTWASDPAMREKVYEFMDKSAIPLRIERGEIDPKTKKQKSPDRILWDDGGKPHPLNDADMQRMLQGIAYSKAGLNDEAEKAFESVNKRLRDAVNEGNRRKLEGYKFEENSRHNLANEELRAEQLGLARDQRRAIGANRPREVPPEILKELSALEQQFIQAEPKDRPGIERQYQMVLSRAGAAVGKPMGLPNARPPAPEPKVNQDGSVVKDGVLYVPNPKKPGEFMPAKGLGPSRLDQSLDAFVANGGAGGAAGAPAQDNSPNGLVQRGRMMQEALRSPEGARVYDIYQRIQNGAPTSPGERAFMNTPEARRALVQLGLGQ